MKNTIEEKIKKMFVQHPTIEELHVTSNGQGFTEPSKADSHAQTLIDKKVKHCKRADYVDAPKTQDQNNAGSDNLLDQSIANLTPIIEAIETVEELEALKTDEEAGQKRKGIYTLIDERIKALTPTDKVPEGGEPTGDSADDQTK